MGCMTLDKNRPTVDKVLPLVIALYAMETVCTRGPTAGTLGGHLHIVLDDQNLESGSVEFCLDIAKEEGCTTCSQIATLMLSMSMTQRRKIANSFARL